MHAHQSLKDVLQRSGRVARPPTQTRMQVSGAAPESRHPQRLPGFEDVSNINTSIAGALDRWYSQRNRSRRDHNWKTNSGIGGWAVLERQVAHSGNCPLSSSRDSLGIGGSTGGRTSQRRCRGKGTVQVVERVLSTQEGPGSPVPPPGGNLITSPSEESECSPIQG